MGTEYSTYPPVSSLLSTDSLLIVRGGLPNRSTFPLPAMDSDGNMVVGGTTSEGKLTVEGNLSVRSGGVTKFRPSTNDFDYSIVVAGTGAASTARLYVIGGFGVAPHATLSIGASLLGSDSVRSGGDNVTSLGEASFRWTTVYASTGSINTSDEREKREIGDIPEEWLDAWGDVEWCRFKFRDGKRWHIGLIAQHVHAAFARRGLDAFDIGLCCHDQWEDQREPVLGKDGKPTKRTRIVQKAGDRWGLRYDECFAIEAAWQRRELARMAKGLSAIGRQG